VLSSERRARARARAEERGMTRDTWRTTQLRADFRGAIDAMERASGGIRGLKLTTRRAPPRRLPFARQLARLLISVIYGQLPGRAGACDSSCDLREASASAGRLERRSTDQWGAIPPIARRGDNNRLPRKRESASRRCGRVLALVFTFLVQSRAR